MTITPNSSTNNFNDLKAAVNLADEILSQTTGLGDFERRLVAFYITSTYFIAQINPFPMLVIKGSTGTGKTTILRVAKHLCFKPVMFSASKMTSAAFRDKLEEANNGTAIIDEADSSNPEREEMLNLRYLKETATAGKKVSAGEGEWVTVEIPVFGATILHKRIPFEDPSVESRSIIVATKAVSNRAFETLEQANSKIESYLKLSNDFSSVKLVTKINKIKTIMPRIMDTYMPVIMVSKTIEVLEFQKQLIKHMDVESIGFRDGQSYEPAALLLQAIISQSDEKGRLKYHAGLKVDNYLTKWILDNHGRRINAFQAAKILRGFELTVRKADGANHVYINDIPKFIRICRSEGIDDEAVENEAKHFGM